MVTGVAFDWSNKKGLDIFNKLASDLGSEYQVILVGTNDETDSMISENIISIHRKKNKKELAEIYTASDLFVNPTREEVLGLVNIEALACGTPIIIFRTGGCPETMNDSCGICVECDDYSALLDGVRHFQRQNLTMEDCLAQASKWDQNVKYEEYITLYG